MVPHLVLYHQLQTSTALRPRAHGVRKHHGYATNNYHGNRIRVCDLHSPKGMPSSKRRRKRTKALVYYPATTRLVRLSHQNTNMLKEGPTACVLGAKEIAVTEAAPVRMEAERQMVPVRGKPFRRQSSRSLPRTQGRGLLASAGQGRPRAPAKKRCKHRLQNPAAAASPSTRSNVVHKLPTKQTSTTKMKTEPNQRNNHNHSLAAPGGWANNHKYQHPQRRSQTLSPP
jgi:hypothetical protein